jgi:hypothetical protein
MWRGDRDEVWRRVEGEGPKVWEEVGASDQDTHAKRKAGLAIVIIQTEWTPIVDSLSCGTVKVHRLMRKRNVNTLPSSSTL